MQWGNLPSSWASATSWADSSGPEGISLLRLDGMKPPDLPGDTCFDFEPRETLIYSILVIASEAKQSRTSAKSMASGSPRHFVPRDDE